MKKTFAFILLTAFIMLAASACTNDKNTNTPVDTPVANTEKNVAEKTEDVVLYYASSDAMGLKGETRTFPEEKARDPQYIVGQLIEGTKEDGLTSVIPRETKINSCTVEDGMCILDVSGEFVSQKGSANEEMIIYSVVNTLCRMEGIDEVKFLVDGEEVTIFGSFIFDEPFTEDTSIIKAGE